MVDQINQHPWHAFTMHHAMQVGFMVDQINQRNQQNSVGVDDPIKEITKTLNLQLTSLKCDQG